MVLLYDLVAKHGADEVVAIGIDFGQQEVNEDERGLSFANNIIERENIKSTAILTVLNFILFNCLNMSLFKASID